MNNSSTAHPVPLSSHQPWLSSELHSNPSIFSAKVWNLHKYADFEMPFETLAESWHAIFLVVAAYLMMVFTVKPVKQQKVGKASSLEHLISALNVPMLDLRICRHAWNTMLALYSILGSVHMASYLIHQISINGLYAAICLPDHTYDQGPVGFWFLLFVLGKVVELGDTIFLLLSGRNVIFLHYWHHATILPCCFYALQNKIPIFRACATINYTIHAVMYSYFAINDTSLCHANPSFRYKWAQKITTMQCTQFIICLAMITIGTYDRYAYNNTDIPYASVVLSYFILGSYLYLFLQFAEEKYAYRSQLRSAVVKFYSQCIGQDIIKRGANNQCQEGNIAPWHRSDYSMDQRFQEATKMAAMFYGSASEEDLETMYGCYKQAKEGPMPAQMAQGAEPTDEKSLTKHRAWKAVQSLTAEEAQKKYIAIMDVLRERSISRTKEKLQKSSKIQTALTSNNAEAGVLYPVRIAGHGRYLPKRVVDNDEVEKMGGFEMSSQEKKRTGVTERRYADIDGGENLIQNGAKAIRTACAQAGITVEDLDLIIGGFGGHQFLPDDASLVQRELGLGESGIRAFTVHATCLSFLVGMEVAGSFMRDRKYQNVAVFASSISSAGIHSRDPHTAGLFGDGAAAIILEPTSNRSGGNTVGNAPGILGCHMETYGIGADSCRIQGGGTNRPPHHPEYKERMSYFEMNGQATLSLVSKYAPTALHNFIPGLERGLNNLQIPNSDKHVNIDWVVPHQASAVAVDSLTMFGWPEEKILKTLHKYGNCVAASLPLTLCDGIDKGTIKRGDRILLVGTSAGLSCASMLLTY